MLGRNLRFGGINPCLLPGLGFVIAVCDALGQELRAAHGFDIAQASDILE